MPFHAIWRKKGKDWESAMEQSILNSNAIDLEGGLL
jgi:hypothetical protein